MKASDLKVGHVYLARVPDIFTTETILEFEILILAKGRDSVYVYELEASHVAKKEIKEIMGFTAKQYFDGNKFELCSEAAEYIVMCDKIKNTLHFSAFPGDDREVEIVKHLRKF